MVEEYELGPPGPTDIDISGGVEDDSVEAITDVIVEDVVDKLVIETGTLVETEVVLAVVDMLA